MFLRLPQELILYFIEQPELPFFLGKAGALECEGGLPVVDKAICELACNQLEMPIKGELSDGLLCFKGNSRKGKGGCNQDGGNSKNALLVCEKAGKYIFLHSKIKSIMGL